MFRILKLVRFDDTKVVYECRRCGTNVSPETTKCPTCDSCSVVRYEIE